MDVNESTLVVGAPHADLVLRPAQPPVLDNVGAVFVLEKNEDGAWEDVGGFNDTGGTYVAGNENDRIGSSVAVSENWIAAGAPGESSGLGLQGAPKDVSWGGSTCTDVKLTAPRYARRDASTNESGAVVLFKKIGSTSWAGAQYLKAPNCDAGDSPEYKAQFGSAVALAGGRLIVGAPGDDTSAPRDTIPLAPDLDIGAAYVFEEQAIDGAGNSWAFGGGLKPFVPGNAPARGGRFGTSVAVSSDGALVAVGAPLDAFNVAGSLGPKSGAAYVYKKEEGEPWGVPKRDKEEVATEGGLFGQSVVFDGDDLWVGSPGGVEPRVVGVKRP